MTANRALMDELGFALKHDERQGWIVIEDGADDRCATITEQVLWDALLSLAATVAPAELDVTKILLNVVPGDDGEGLEIYAKSVDDVVALLTKQGERIEELESRVAVPVAPAIPRTAATCSDAAYQLGLAVRAALDRVACPDAFMRVAAEAVFARHAEYPGPPAPVAPADPECERCGLTPAQHDHTHWCDNQSFRMSDGSTQLGGAAPVAPSEHINLRRADGTLSGVFIEPAASEAAAVAAELRNWFDFLPGHAQPTIELAVRLLETRP